jgi:hypothetical protein
MLCFVRKNTGLNLSRICILTPFWGRSEPRVPFMAVLFLERSEGCIAVVFMWFPGCDVWEDL